MHVSISHLLAVTLLTYSAAVAASTPPPWPENPSRLQLDTPYGELHVSPSEYVYESRLMLDDHEIEPSIKGLLNIPYAFSSPKFHVALISVNTGDNNCPVTYKWVMIKEGGYTVTPRFGSCSESIRVVAQGATFILETPSEQDPTAISTYIYDGKTIKKKASP